MATTRRSTRKHDDYRSFIPDYFRMLYQFDALQGSEIRRGPMALKAARALRQDIYRWLSRVREARKAMPNDEMATELDSIAARVMWRVEPIDGGNAYLVLALHPLRSYAEPTETLKTVLQERYNLPPPTTMPETSDEELAALFHKIGPAI